MEDQIIDSELGTTPSTATLDTQWGPGAPKGARAVSSRIIKEGANVPLFLGQTMISALRDLGYNHTTSAICEHVDNSFQWGAQEVRVYFHEKGKKGARKIDVLIIDDGVGMSPNVLRAVTAFGGSLCYDNRQTVGKYGMGMKAAALSMGPTLEIFSWQEKSAIYRMILDTEAISNERTNVVQLPEPVLMDSLPPEVREILVQPMSFPRSAEEQDLYAQSDEDLADRLGTSGTIVYIPDRTQPAHAGGDQAGQGRAPAHAGDREAGVVVSPARPKGPAVCSSTRSVSSLNGNRCRRMLYSFDLLNQLVNCG